MRAWVYRPCTVVKTHSYSEYMFSGTERKLRYIVAYLHCIDKLVSITFIVFIRNTRLPGASIYQLAVAARHAGACMRLYNFAVHAYLNYACLHQLTSLYCSYFTSNELADKRSRISSPCDGVAVFLEQMNEGVKYLGNVSEEQIRET